MTEMDLKTIISIPLEKYGGKGVVEVSAPTLRRKIEMKNQLGKLAKMSVALDEKDEGRKVDITLDEGYQYIITNLVYVRKAPFPLDVEGFLRYCDRLDERELGMGELLLDTIHEATLAIDSGDASPFVTSLRQENGTSE